MEKINYISQETLIEFEKTRKNNKMSFKEKLFLVCSIPAATAIALAHSNSSSMDEKKKTEKKTTTIENLKAIKKLYKDYKEFDFQKFLINFIQKNVNDTFDFYISLYKKVQYFSITENGKLKDNIKWRMCRKLGIKEKESKKLLELITKDLLSIDSNYVVLKLGTLSVTNNELIIKSNKTPEQRIEESKKEDAKMLDKRNWHSM